MIKCAVVGGGAWGTAIADLLRRNGHDVSLWAFEQDVAKSISKHNENLRFLKGHKLAPGIRGSSDIASVVQGAQIVVFATPSIVLRQMSRAAAPSVGAGVPVVVATKGIEQGTHALMTDVVASEIPQAPVVALSGPSFAVEVVRCQPTAVVLASVDESVVKSTQQIFNSPYFRTYSHSDVTGVELGGALKNVMAVATGVADGLGLGFNARAALITRGLAEMIRLGTSLGAEASTFAGLAGLGDLVLTCTGSLSRNREVGVEVGKGKALADVLRGKETVAEGVVAAKSALELATKQGITMPIVEAVNRVLFDGQHPREAMGELMTRELRAEADR
ncbi:MAG: NAD(P)-dependent glycerol-3-phosphate dehydrogenase [Gemmatimonadaceae bacterium]|nr:NAD(P)-dependent glycerol-3-phosphate dehydrogenase [Gemmatimonadaceae bacterium]